MGIRQNLKLWENNVVYLNHDGVYVMEKVPRVWPLSPWQVVRRLSARGWLFFIIAILAWTADGYDFNAVNLVASNLAEAYDRSLTAITLSVTLTLLFRASGAAIFGLLTDMFGRKWILAIDLTILAALQVATAFAGSFEAFIGVRAIFGIAMGGIYGPASTVALENMPVESRGAFSGLFQNGYAMGYILAAMVNTVAVPATSQGYKMVFYVGAGFTATVAIIIMCIPESAIFAKKPTDEGHADIGLSGRISLFWRDASLAARQYWKMFLYCILFATAYNWMSHSVQDIYPSYVKIQKGFTAHQANLATITGQCGAIIGGTLAGYYSQFFGRRLTSITCITIAWLFVPLFTLPSGFSAITLGTFCLQTMVNAAWGIMPIMLNEWAPPQFRGVFSGTVYQLGNMLSAPAAQAQTAAASAWIKNGKPNYSQVMTIFECVIFFICIVVCACGPERLGSHFEVVKRAGDIENIQKGELALGIAEGKVAELEGNPHATEVEEDYD